MRVRTSSIFWALLVTFLVMPYAVIGAGILGLAGARTVSVVALSGALGGCLAALGYLRYSHH